MKSRLLILILFLFPVLLSAKVLTKNELTTLGVRAFHQRALSMCPPAAGYSLKNCDFLMEGNDVCMAVLHFEHGFLIMSAEDAVMPVLAYDFTNDLDLDNIAPAVEQFLSQYKEEIASTRRLQLEPTKRIRDAWAAIRQPNRAAKAEAVVPPLLTSSWNQNKYYNYYSPVDENSPNGYDGKTPNGCVAIAMSQIIFYYRYPESGSGSHTNYTSDYGNFYVNFGQQHYNYDAMTDKLSFYNNEVAKLIFHCATAVDMNYGADGSGASSQDVPDAMSNYFKFSTDCYHRSKWGHSDSAWHVKLKTDIDAFRPVYYSGYSEEGGHAFVCDGYDNEDFFHFNFGWGGSGNGYFLTESSDNSAVGGYSNWQSAVFNLHPREGVYPTYCNDRVITSSNGTLEDGSGPQEYPNNAHCTYVIAQPNLYSIQLSLQYLFTQEGHDYLKFWDGNPSQGNLLLELSGTMAEGGSYNFNTDSLFITFESDDSVTAQGWRLSFQTFVEGVGCGTHAYHDGSGVISDNSGDFNYRDNSNCSWILRLYDSPSVTFTFEELDISPEDHLDFYRISGTPSELLYSFTGSSIPAPITIYENNIRVKFISDNYLSGQGFRVLWSTSQAGIEDFCSAATVYPNPASDILHVSLAKKLEECTVTIYNMIGDLQFVQSYGDVGSMEIPVGQFTNGVYLMVLESQGQTFHQKIVIRH